MANEDQSSVLNPQLWVERSVEDTQAVYTDWASRYDAEVQGRGYHSPRRIAEALARHLQVSDKPVLDFGCGTGLSGLALRAAGFALLHGTDINEAMIAQAQPRGIYDKLWVSPPGTLDIEANDYGAIVATGVISLGAAPPETLDMLADKLPSGAMLALSFNDPTLEHGGFDAALQMQLDAGSLNLIERTHGPHLDDVKMGSDVIVLQKI